MLSSFTTLKFTLLILGVYVNSINKLIVATVKIFPKSVVFLFAKKYIAGTTLQNAVDVVKSLNSKKIAATLDVLGEAITQKSEAEATRDECFRVLDVIEKNKLDSNLSIKLTSLGLNIDEEFCYTLVRQIVEKAKNLNNFIRIDMEDSPFTSATIEVYKKIRTEFDNVGLVLQAYMKRTLNDIENLKELKPNYRLCKGIYVESDEIAYKDKQEIRDNYLKALNKMLDNESYVGIATHDKYLIDEAYKIIAERKLSKDKFEFQMLYGVTHNLRDKINSDGYKIRIYVPYGEHWYPYSVRRMQENPQVARYVFNSIFKFS